MKNSYAERSITSNYNTGESIEISFIELNKLINDTFILFEPGLKKFNIQYTIDKFESEFEFKVTSKIDSILLSLVTRLLTDNYANLLVKIKFKLIWNNLTFQPEKLRIRFLKTNLKDHFTNKLKKSNDIFDLMNLSNVKIKLVDKKNAYECIDVELPIAPLSNPKFTSIIDLDKNDLRENETDSEQNFISRLKAHIDGYNSIENIEFDNLCNHFAVSRSTLYRKIKLSTGLSPSKFIRSHYLDLAAVRLKITNDPITEIAYDFGFNNSSYFSKSFKDQFNESPLSYRKKSRLFL